MVNKKKKAVGVVLKTYSYQDLVDASNNNHPIDVTSVTRIQLRNLTKRTYYTAEFYFWSREPQNILLEITNPYDGSTSLTKEVAIGRNLNKDGKDFWTVKRYKINKDRHSGRCTIFVRPGSENHVFKMVAAPLVSKKTIREQKINNGLCPVCNVQGYWVNMAMVCDEHGSFIGG